MYCNLEFNFIHNNQNENAKAIVTFDNRIHCQKKKKHAKNPSQNLLFLSLKCLHGSTKIVTYMKEVMHFSQN